MARILVAIAWPYANGPFHLGHLAGAYLPGDTFARYHRLRGNEVLMVSGSDMHGTPTLVTAEREGVTPAEVASRYHAINKAGFEALGFSFDLFTTTHTVVHEKTVQEIFLALLENGFIERRTAEGAYCPKHQRFLPDRYLVGTCPHCGFDQARGDECDHCGRPLEPRQLRLPRCALCGTPAEFRPSEHFYLELDRLAPKLAEWLGRQEHWRPGTLRVAENFLTEGLHPTPITRDLEWGIPIPLDGYADKRFYVWFDAVTGYLSASKEWAIRTGAPDAWHRFWDVGEPVRPYYFIGKDNRFHHTIIWPAMLLGAGGLHLPYDVPANEWLNVRGGRISKSRTEDRAVFIPSLLEHYPPDVIRFYAALLAPQNHDTELDWAEFHKVRDEVLANQYGNLVQRTLVLARDRYGGALPSDLGPVDPVDETARRIRAAHDRITEEYDRVHLKEALDLTLTEVRAANRRFHEARPWQAADPERARIVYESAWWLKALATWLSPVLPFSSAEVFRMLGEPAGPSAGAWDRVTDPPARGQRLGEVRPLFPRPTAPAEGSAAVAPPAGPPAPPRAGPIPLSVRAGVVRSVVNHPSADKLYVLEVDVGEPERRTVVAGLRGSYSPEELRERRVALLANLAPRTIRRMTSQGMILAADHGERAVLVEPPQDVGPGAWASGASAEDRTIAYEEFASISLRVGRVEGAASPGHRRVTIGDRSVSVPGNWPVGLVGVVRLESANAETGALIEFGEGRAAHVKEEVPAGARVR